MDSVVVLKDQVVLRLLEANYCYGTHFVPGGLPGMGMGIGDVFQHEDKTYLTLHRGVTISNNLAMHLVRERESALRRWPEVKGDLYSLSEMFLKKLSEADENCFGQKVLRDAVIPWETEVGWNQVKTPDAAFVLALQALHKDKKVPKELADEALELANMLEPFVDLHTFLSSVRRGASHKGYPVPSGNIFSTNTPAASGGASWHSVTGGDDLRDCTPGVPTLAIVASQAGRTGIMHLGAGTLKGEHYLFMFPEADIIPAIRQEIDSSQKLKATWEEISSLDASKEEELLKALSAWTHDDTLEIKREFCRELVPGIANQRVLGFYIDLISTDMDLRFQPVISESCFETHSQLIEDEELKVIHAPFEDFLLEDAKSYYGCRSVFD